MFYVFLNLMFNIEKLYNKIVCNLTHKSRSIFRLIFLFFLNGKNVPSFFMHFNENFFYKNVSFIKRITFMEIIYLKFMLMLMNLIKFNLVEDS